MFKYLIARLFVAFLISFLVPINGFSASSSLSWEVWFRSQILKNPEIVAAREQMNSDLSFADGREKPLYNPEINSELEREGQYGNYRLGVSQIVDWQNKRGVRTEQSVYSRVSAQQTFELAVQEKAAEALSVLTDWRAASEQAALALTQEDQLTRLLELVDQRLDAGDLSQIDAELSILNLSQRLNATAQALARLAEAESSLRELLPDWSPQMANVPDEFWTVNNSVPVTQLVETHPAVRAARAQWEVLRKSAELAQLETKADPRVGVNAGRSGREDVVALTFSIPLNVRNNFSAQVRAANQQALSAEAQYLSVRRKKQFDIESSQSALREYQIRYERWQELIAGRGDRGGDLLDNQWESGDISTTEYLISLQQLSDGLSAGIELQNRFQLARIKLLLQTGRIPPVITPFAQ